MTAKPTSSAEAVVAPVGPVIGDLIAGKYVVERVIGRGGMGLVVAAHHVALQQRVAIKLLLPQALSNADVVARFVREAQAVAALRSEHVARVMDVGTLESGSPYIVMEHLEGKDLGQLVTENQPLGVEEAVDYVLQSLDAVAEAHARGLVHRDLKPSNLFRTTGSDGFPLIKVLDFGISKPMVGEGADVSLTSTGAVMGSPIYMSPEQVRSSRAVDLRSDIWSIGVILYELLTGRSPFVGQTLGEVFAAILEASPTAPRDLVPGIPEELELVILCCLQRDIELRIPDVAVLAMSLAPFASPRLQPLAERIDSVFQTTSRVSRPPPARTSRNVTRDSLLPERGTLIEWGRTGRPPANTKKTSGRGVAFGAFGLAALCGVGGWWIGNRAPAASAYDVGSAVSPPSTPFDSSAVLSSASADATGRDAPAKAGAPAASASNGAPVSSSIGVAVSGVPSSDDASAASAGLGGKPGAPSKPLNKPAIKPAAKPAGTTMGKSTDVGLDRRE